MNLLDIILEIICMLTFRLLCFGVPDETAPPTPSLPPSPTNAPGEWSMTLDVHGPNKAAALPLYQRGAARWARIIRGDQADITDTSNLGAIPYANEHGCKYPTMIDDMYLCVWDGYIDGSGFGSNTLAVASPWLRRNSGGSTTPYVGIAKFDSADVVARIRDGTFQTVVNHEIGHSLGLGSLWSLDKKCPSTAASNSPKANQELRTLGGCDKNAMTTSDCGHWDPACFNKEFLVPTISKGAKISRITVGAIEDLGYTVDYSGADAYGYSDLGSSCKCKGRRLGETADAAEEFTTDATTSTTPWMSSSSNHSPRERRRLSDAAHAKATVDGRAFLKELVAVAGGTKDAADGHRALLGDNDEFIEHTAVVYIEENGEIYAVHVNAG